MRAVLLIVAFAALIAICQGAGGGVCTGVPNCAQCQDSKNKCAYCASGYQASGKTNCIPNSAYTCPAAAGPNCLSCSPPSPGTGGSTPACQKGWNPSWGCTKCARGYYFAQSTTPLPAGTGVKCGGNMVRTCSLTPGGK